MANDPDNWMETQRELWTVWRSILEQLAPGGAAAPAGDRVGDVWRQFGSDPVANGPIGAFADLFSPWVMARPGSIGPEAFTQSLNRTLEAWLQSSAGSAGKNSAPIEMMNEFFCSPLRLWQVAFDKREDPFGAAAWPGMAPSEFAARRDLPPLGITREWELAWRAVHRADADQVEAGNALGRHLTTIYHTALTRFAKAISGDNIDDGEITSLRELYDLWVSIAEEAYAEVVMTTEYSQAFGNFINASASGRKARHALANDMLEAMNWPNRRELDSIIERQHSLQAEVRALGARVVCDADLDALQRRVEALSQRLDGRAAARPKRSTPKAATKAGKAKLKPVPGTRVAAPAKRRPPKTKRGAKPAASASRSAGEFDIGAFTTADDRR